MSRPKRGEQSSFSLFPFLAVLLCTMGAMVVLLVAMAHVSRQKAEQEAVVAQAAAEQAAEQQKAQLALEAPERLLAKQQLAEAQAAENQVEVLRDQVKLRLHGEQQRLSDIEDHLRRLREEEERLMFETAELLAVEEEHEDDLEVARQEVDRLNKLIGELEDELEELKYAANGRERRYAIVPLRDEARGTLRPAIYFECTAEGITIQPEGIELTEKDLIAPDVSSPVAAAVRTLRRFYLDFPETRAAGEQGEPYPLLIVRPEGVSSFYKAKAALENVKADFGYQPIAEGWPIEYDEPNPILSQRLVEEIELIRRERQEIARLQPSRFRNASGSTRRRQRVAGFGEGTGAGSSSGSGLTVQKADPRANNPFEGIRFDGVDQVAEDTSGEMASATQPFGSQPGNSPTLLAADQSKNSAADNLTADDQGVGQSTTGGPDGGESYGASQPESDATYEATATADGSASSGNADKLTQSDPSQASQSTSQVASSDPSQLGSSETSNPQSSQGQPQANSATASNATRQGSGASGRGGRRGIPIVRPIRMLVTADQVALLPDRAPESSSTTLFNDSTATVEFSGATVLSINELIAELKQHAESWGIAGEGMYWDPKLQLDVSSNGEQRAEEIVRLLRAAGLNTFATPGATASNQEGDADEPLR